MKKLVSLVFSPTAKNTYLLFTGNIVDAFFAFLFTVILFRLLPTSQFGIFSAVNNFIIVSYSLMDFGISSGIINFVSHHRAKSDEPLARRYFLTGLFLRGCISAVVSLVVIGLSWFIAPRLFLTPQSSIVVFAGIAIFGLSLLDVLYYSFQAYQRFLSSALVSISFTSTRLLLLLLFQFLHLPFSLPTALIITAIAPFVGILPALGRFHVLVPRPERSIAKSLLSFSGWMGIVRIFSSITGRLDVQMMLLLAGPLATGTYSVAARLASFYAVIVTSFTAVLAPKLASGQPLSTFRPLLSKALLALSGLLAAMVFGILIARPFILLLFGAKAASSVVPFQALTLAFMPFMAASLATTIIIYNLKKPKVLGLLAILQLVCVFAGNYFFIPRFGSIGPALTIGLTNLIVLVISCFYVFRSWR